VGRLLKGLLIKRNLGSLRGKDMMMAFHRRRLFQKKAFSDTLKLSIKSIASEQRRA
jgi:hypothetical protein